MKKGLILIIFLSVLFSQPAFAKKYPDVPYGYWDYSSIDKMTDEDIISADKYFMPKSFITRAEYAKGIIKILKQEDNLVQNPYAFDDINNKNENWKYIVRALDLDILKPVSKHYFAPNEFVTRTDMITFLVNILKTEDITKKEALSALQNAYLDYDDIPDWFKVTAGKAEVLGVIAKEPPRTQYLDCEKYITRAQFAFFMNKLKEITENYVKEKEIEESSPKVLKEGGLIIDNTMRDGDIVTLPSQTALPIFVLNYLKSGKTPSGTIFHAKFADDIIDENRYHLLSKDIILTGKVLNSEKSLPLIKNGKILLELTTANNKGISTRIEAVADCEPHLKVTNKIAKTAATIAKGRNFTVSSGQVIFIRLYKPLRVNIVTGDILD